jgi:hypothetical protein
MNEQAAAPPIEFYCVDCGTIYGRDPSACIRCGSVEIHPRSARSEKGRKG